MITMAKNEYPTPLSREQFKADMVHRATLINNMRVNLESNPKSRADYVQGMAELRKNSVSESKTEKLVISGKKPKIMMLRKPTNGHLCIIDWINFVFDVRTIGDKFVRDGQDDDFYMSMCQEVAGQVSERLVFLFGKRYAITSQNQTGRNFYKYSFNIGEGYGVVCVGGQRDTVLVMLTGTGCALMPQGWEHHLADFLSNEAVKGRITRIDLAHDDINGEYLNLETIDGIETAGGFSCGGASPDVGHLGNWKNNDPYNKGLTLTIGQRASGKYARFYQKGKKEGDKESKWVRAEIEFKAVDRVLPFDMLINPSDYFVGAYPCFEDLFFRETSIRLTTNRKQAEVNLLHAFNWINRQAGKYISLFSQFLEPQAIVETLKNKEDDLPQRLHLSTVIYGLNPMAGDYHETWDNSIPFIA